MKYRVKIKISYCEAFFEFDDATQACDFMTDAAKHVTKGGDKTDFSLTVITEEA